MANGHPDLADVEAVRLGEGSLWARDHVETCPDCTRIMADLGRIEAELRAIDPPRIEVPAEVRNAIRAQAALAPRRRRVALRVPLAAAAAIALAAIGFFRIFAPGAPVAFAPEDVDRNGRVDILDAYTLARAIRGGGPLDPRHDLNGDGLVDRKDVDHAARAGVSIAGRTP